MSQALVDPRVRSVGIGHRGQVISTENQNQNQDPPERCFCSYWVPFFLPKAEEITPYSHQSILLSCISRANILVYEDHRAKQRSRDGGGLESSPSPTPLDVKPFIQSIPLPWHVSQGPGNSPACAAAGPHAAFTHSHPGNSKQFAFTKPEHKDLNTSIEISREVSSEGPGVSLLPKPARQLGSFAGPGCAGETGEMPRAQPQKRVLGRTGRKGNGNS